MRFGADSKGWLAEMTALFPLGVIAICEVTHGASGFRLRVGNANSFSDENSYVNLGF